LKSQYRIVGQKIFETADNSLSSPSVILVPHSINRRQKGRKTMVQKEIRGLVAVWSVRALLRPRAFRVLASRLPGDDDVLRAIGLDALIDCEISRREMKKR